MGNFAEIVGTPPRPGDSSSQRDCDDPSRPTLAPGAVEWESETAVPGLNPAADQKCKFRPSLPVSGHRGPQV